VKSITNKLLNEKIQEREKKGTAYKIWARSKAEVDRHWFRKLLHAVGLAPCLNFYPRNPTHAKSRL
jgi:hypothetical protein